MKISAVAVVLGLTVTPEYRECGLESADLDNARDHRLHHLTGCHEAMYQPAYSFKNQWQFVAVTNVSQNLGISFGQLKIRMTWLSVPSDGTVTLVDTTNATSPAPTKSLGRAMRAVKSSVNAAASAETATMRASAETRSTMTASK